MFVISYRSRALRLLYGIQTLFCAILCLCIQPAVASAVLDSSLTDAASHDFISYFGFKENKIDIGKDGLVNHNLYSSSWTSFLVLSIDSNAHIVHMKLGVPRPLIDDEKITTRGRDIVKSFVLAAALDDDHAALNDLADEIYVRGLDLQPIKVDAKTLTEMGSSASQLQAFKVGKGPVSNGDNAVFLPKLPNLSSSSSDLFEAVMAKRPHAGRVFHKCRIAFVNQEMKGSRKPMKLLWCEAWDEPYWLAHNKPAAHIHYTSP